MTASTVNHPTGLIGFMALRDRIAEAIEGSGRSKADVARACKVTNAAVTHWITGGTLSLKADTALALEDVTGYRAQWILSGRGSKTLGETYWPFTVSIARFDALTDKQKGYVDAKLEQAIEACEMATMSDDEQRRFDQLSSPLKKTRSSVKKAA